MRIVVDLQGAQTAGSRFRGLGRYSVSMAQALARQAGEHELWICVNATLRDSLAPIRLAFDGLVPASRIRAFHVPVPVAWSHPENAWRRRAAEHIRESFLAGLAPDLVHVPSLFEGAEDTAVLSVGRFERPFPTVVTLHDLIPLLNPGGCLGTPWLRAWYMDKIASLKRAELLLSVSEHSRTEAVQHLGIPGTRIITIGEGPSPVFRPRTIGVEELQMLTTRYGIRQPYVMYSGTTEVRKNVDRLVQAFSLLAPEIRASHQLVLVGRASDEERERLCALAAQLGIGDGLVLTGYVSDEDLVVLCSACGLYVFPSLQEGFGLPPLEAMACGAPTIASRATSLPEVIGWNDALFDPADAGAIAAMMSRALTDERFSRALRTHAVRQAAKFSWDSSAKRAIDAFEELHSRHGVAPQGRSVLRRDREQEYRGLIDALAALPAGPAGPSQVDLVGAAEAIVQNQHELEGLTSSGSYASSLGR